MQAVMAEVEGISKPPLGYEPLPTSDPVLLKEKDADDDNNHAPRTLSRRHCLARHALRLSAILGVLYVLVFSGRQLWHGCVSTGLYSRSSSVCGRVTAPQLTLFSIASVTISKLSMRST